MKTKGAAEQRASSLPRRSVKPGSCSTPGLRGGSGRTSSTSFPASRAAAKEEEGAGATTGGQRAGAEKMEEARSTKRRQRLGGRKVFLLLLLHHRPFTSARVWTTPTSWRPSPRMPTAASSPSPTRLLPSAASPTERPKKTLSFRPKSGLRPGAASVATRATFGTTLSRRRCRTSTGGAGGGTGPGPRWPGLEEEGKGKHYCNFYIKNQKDI